MSENMPDRYYAMPPPFGYINFVDCARTAAELLLDVAEYMHSLGAELLEWRILYSGGPVRYHWKEISEAKGYWREARLEGATRLQLDVQALANPRLHSIEVLSSIGHMIISGEWNGVDDSYPDRKGNVATINYSASELYYPNGPRTEPHLESLEESEINNRRIFDWMPSAAGRLGVSYASTNGESVLQSCDQIDDSFGKHPLGNFYVSKYLLSEQTQSLFNETHLPPWVHVFDHGISTFPSSDKHRLSKQNFNWIWEVLGSDLRQFAKNCASNKAL